LETGGRIAGISDMESLYADYWSNIPRNTDKLSQDWPEMLRKVSFNNGSESEEVSLAEMVAVMSYDLGGQTGLALIDQGCAEGSSMSGEEKQKAITAATLLSQAAIGRPQKVIRLSASEDVFVF